MKPALLKPPQVAERLGLSMTATYALLSTNQIPSVRIGNGPKAHYRVDPDVLDRWIASRQSKPAPNTAADLVGALKSIKTRKSEREALGLEEDHEFVM